MNVLSLFDGMSCGQLALNRLGITNYNYYASEIDKHAIQVTQSNFPNTIQVGDITKLNSTTLPKIDLLIGGSPCQGFSFAGKQLNFEDERSKLFFEYVRLKNELNPKYFLLENVKMKKEYQDIISEHIGVEPIEINSNLVSAQNRRRLYWTNIPNINQPEDKHIYLNDILEYEFHYKYLLNEDTNIKYNKLYDLENLVVDVSYNKLKGFNDKSPTLLAQSYGGTTICINIDYKKLKVYDDGKTPTLLAKPSNGGKMFLKVDKRLRRFTPIECERLQTIPDNYTNYVSDTQRYKMIGNGWTIDVISHILKNII
jgi:site-specific DNA-cytosine methylase